MKKIMISSLAVVSMLSVMSCKTDFDTDVADVAITKGEADFSNYVALGNSLTSGYRDGALYSSGQLESYPSIVASQMQKAGGGAFTQPMMPNDVGGFSNLPDFPGKLVLVNGSLAPTYSAPGGTLDKLTGTFNNMGVPGAKSFHLVADGYGSETALALKKANPYFFRFASSDNTSVLKDAIAQKPTFYSLWIGNNDVLSYATSGGVGKDQTGNLDPRTYGSNDITDPNVLAGSIKAILDGMKAVGATKGVIANIPDITSIPFFTTIPSMLRLDLTEAQAAGLMSMEAYGKYNAALKQAKTLGLLTAEEYNKRVINFVAGNVVSGLVIEDKDLTNLSALGIPSYRQTTSGDFILLPYLKFVKEQGGGTKVVLKDEQVLTYTEAKRVQVATAKYNASIKALADAYGLAFVDANAKMVELNGTSGIQFDGVKYTTSFLTGGAFSLDGVHLTGRGYAVIANEFIKAINAKYKSTLPQVNPNNYSGIKFP